jgi:hypothetical protein
MKKAGIYIVGLLGMLACSPDKLSPEEGRIIGKWQLAEYCVGSVTGSCTPQVATAITSQTLEFKKNGSFMAKIPQPGKFQTPIVSSGEYHIAAGGIIRFRFDAAASFTNEVEWHYTLTDEHLTIEPQCYEGCTYTYQRL